MNHLLFIKRVLILCALFFLFDFITSVFLIKGLNNYFGFDENPKVLINGSSMAGAGFSKQSIEEQTDLNIAKYTLEGVSVEDRYAMVEQFFEMFPNEDKIVIYEVNPVLFSGMKTSENVYTHFYPYMDDERINAFIKSEADKKEYLIRKLIRSLRFDSRLMITVMRGYLGNDENVKKNSLDSAAIIQLYQQRGLADVVMREDKVELFEKTVSLVLENNSEVLLIMMPMHQAKLETFDETGYNELISYLEVFSSSNAKVDFINLNLDSLIQDAGNFSDPLHYNAYGQDKIDKIISEYLLTN